MKTIVGNRAPRQGSLQRTTQHGVGAYMTPAITRFPPPDFLSETQTQLWVATLSDVPLEFFRARHLPFMIQYVRMMEHMMRVGQEYEEDPEDTIILSQLEKMMRICKSLENTLGLSIHTLRNAVDRARTDHRVAQQDKNAMEADEDMERTNRAGLTYASN